MTLRQGNCYNTIVWRFKIYAIIETGGKQYKVTPGQTVVVERLEAAEGETVELDKVLLLAEGDKVTVGQPTVSGARVIATSKGEFKDKKIIVLKYKPKTRYRKKTGHRQWQTRLFIDRIVEPESADKTKPARKTRRPKKEVTENGA